MKINWFSPLPPAHSGTARQTMAILPHLARRAEVTVWSSEQDAKIDPLSQVTLKQFDPKRPPWREISRADVSFYQLANERRQHYSIWRISRQHPGVVILHDLQFQTFFAPAAAVEADARYEYLELSERHHGLNGRVAAEDFLRGRISLVDLAKVYPVTGAAIENALAIVVGADESVLPNESNSPPRVRLSFANADAEKYAIGLLEIVARLPVFQRNWIANHLAERAGEGIAGWQSAFDRQDQPLQDIAAQIQILAAPERTT